MFAAFGASFFFGSILEAALNGPYTTWFNFRMRDRANEAGLVGQPEANVELVLGRANELYAYGPVGSNQRSYSYSPYPYWPGAQVKVFCQAGVVTGVKLFDD